MIGGYGSLAAQPVTGRDLSAHKKPARPSALWVVREDNPYDAPLYCGDRVRIVGDYPNDPAFVYVMCRRTGKARWIVDKVQLRRAL